jgi:PAS domain S-box-containing protein
MKQVSNSPLFPSSQELTEQLLDLFHAQAVAAWLTDTEHGSSLLSESHAGTTPSTSPFRKQLPAEAFAQLTRKPSYIHDNPSRVSHFVLKSASIKNLLILPLTRANRPIGAIIATNLTAWTDTTKQLAQFMAERVSKEWSLQLQVAQQQQQLQEMTDQSRQWQAIYMGVQESIVLLNTKGKILMMNPATEAITGHKVQDMIDRHVGELFPKIGPLGSGIDYPGLSGLYQTLREQRPSDVFEAVVETKDKRHIWVNYTYTPLWDGSGNMIGLIRVTSDVSTIKTVEQMKNDFVSIASHELRTPLGVIMGYLNLFLAGQLGDLTNDQQTFLERIYHSSADMAALVEDLLNISRIEAGRLEVTKQTFGIDQLVAEVLNHLELRAQVKDIGVQVKHSRQAKKIQADRQKIEQALTNIIDNAIKYTYAHGVIYISTKAKNGYIEISVTDSGVGINPESIGHIFEKFYRESNPLSVKEGGSGLGLYISRKLIELHGGTITVTSKPGRGSTFVIKLPQSAGRH